MATYVLVHGAWSGAHGFRHVRPTVADARTRGLHAQPDRDRRAGPPGQPPGRPDHPRPRRRQPGAVRGPRRHRAPRLLLRRHGRDRRARARRPPGAPPRLPGRVRPRRRPVAGRPDRRARDGTDRRSARRGSCRRRRGTSTIRQRPPSRRCGGRPTRSPASPSRSAWPSPSRTSRSRRTYIRATGDVPDSPGGQAFTAAAQRARTSPAWEYHEIAHRPHGPQQPPRGAGGHPGGAGLRRTAPLAAMRPARRMRVPRVRCCAAAARARAPSAARTPDGRSARPRVRSRARRR